MVKMVNTYMHVCHPSLKKRRGGKGRCSTPSLSDMTNLFRIFKFQFGKVYPGAESLGQSFHWKQSHFLELNVHGVVSKESKTLKNNLVCMR